MNGSDSLRMVEPNVSELDRISEVVSLPIDFGSGLYSASGQLLIEPDARTRDFDATRLRDLLKEIAGQPCVVAQVTATSKRVWGSLVRPSKAQASSRSM